MKYLPPIFIFIVAFVIRLLYLYQYKNNPLFDVLFIDSLYYDNWAMDIVKGNWLGDAKPYPMGPIYPYILAFIYLIFGHNLFVVRVIQFFIGALNCVLVYFIGKKIFNNKVGITAGIVLAFYSPSLFYEGLITKESFAEFFILVALTILVYFNSAFCILHSAFIILAGLFLGLASLARENNLLLVPMILLWSFFYFKKKTYFLLFSLYFLLGLFIAIFPVTIRNYLVGKESVLITTKGGFLFYIANNKDARGVLIPERFDTQEIFNLPGTYRDFHTEAEKITGKKLTQSQASSFWFRKSLEFIFQNPLHFVSLLCYRFVLFLNHYEMPDIYDFYFFKKLFSVLSYSFFTFSIIAPFGLLGLLLSFLERKSSFIILYIFILTYLISVLPFYPLSRYRIVMMPFLIIFSSYSFWYIIENFVRIQNWLMFQNKLKMKDFHTEFISASNLIKVAVACIILILATTFVNHNINGFIPGCNFEWSYTQLGLAYQRKGMIDNAINEYQNAIKINPSFIKARNLLGNIYIGTAEYDKAINEFSEIIKIDKNNSYSYNNLGVIYNRLGNYELAVDYLLKAIELKSREANPRRVNIRGSYLELSSVYKNMGDLEKAKEMINEADKWR